MSKPTRTTAKADDWFEAYIALGPGRSLRKLIAESQQLARRNGLGNPPSEATIFRWSSRFGWDRKAQAHDHEATERARAQLLQRRADMAEQRLEVALEHTMAFHSLVRSALTVEEPILDTDGTQRIEVHADGSFTPLVTYRPAMFRELSRQDINALISLHNTAVATERALLAGAADRYQQYQDDQGEDGPGVTVLGPEAITELGVKVGRLVKYLAATTERRRAEKSLSSTERDPYDDESTPPESDDPDAPNLLWEEVDDDDA